ncbi:MAG: DEAD/DEAH box helicase [Euryarchaeota archaeon]|jgi:ATP-dependent RNA helicase RhlE|nr:DEAD/DEAH box helicase [Euryarchaeota archaeon]MBT5594522.1 DEAD/DEAH box helicase [Euryarchaeota archaeon]MBT5843612.1 DEAD/DEAH box helicase [Euryarchaeota archaeon]MBT6640191.1 DEAD/DEAH box helicase [Euryarchaeota archaeon]MBT6845601.1 DEAD/DEAH box helicase [Euryarchaeota archaeon]
MTDFQSLGLSNILLRAVESEGYTTPTPVQEQSIPPLLEGRDVLGVAQTGTGKTAAFALPVLQIMNRQKPQGKRFIRALVLSPTRELAAQIDERFAAYSEHMDLRHRVIFGGVNQNPQVRALQKGLDILVATPGRLLDLIGQGHLDITRVEFFVLDEADRMLDMGFIRDIEKVIKLLPKRRQNLLFSATMPKSIAKLAGTFLHNAVMVDVSPKEMTVDRIQQKIMFLRKADKRRLLVQLIKDERVQRGIVFTRTKHGANRLVKQLDQSNISAAAIHGNKSQGARTKALAGFKDGNIPILVATDIASRGIDVDGITHVFNYDLPNEPESYVHRIGRTARAGKSGIAYAFCDDSESGYLVGIQQLIGKEIPVLSNHPFHFIGAIPKPGQKPGKVKDKSGTKKRPRNQNQNQQSRGNSQRNSSSQKRGNRSGGQRNNNQSRGQGDSGSRRNRNNSQR